MAVAAAAAAPIRYHPSLRGDGEPFHPNIGTPLTGGPGNVRWQSWEAYHLAQGVKIALDYLYLPVPANAGAVKGTKDNAKRLATRARHWAQACKYSGPFSTLPILTWKYTNTRLSCSGYEITRGQHLGHVPVPARRYD